VIRLCLVALRLLRYRVAAMVWMFMLLAAGYSGGLSDLSWAYALAACSLAASYIAATTVNDVADRDIDRINHPRDPARPLVTGEATERELYAIHVGAATLALASAAAIGPAAAVLAFVSLAIGWGYSLPPLRLCYRSYLAPLALAAAYVLVPYALGLVVAEASFGGGHVLFAGALFSLFVARILLKDFRDREGDAAFGKPTLLLRFGRSATCLASAVALAAGSALLWAAVGPPLVLAVLIAGFVAAIASRLHALHRARSAREEQLAIGLGARMGNGLLLTVLAWFALAAQGAAPAEQTGFALALATVFALGFAAVVTRPDDAVIGYKG
jgi:4-hydroxybenzoate polyprenyltransferase